METKTTRQSKVARLIQKELAQIFQKQSQNEFRGTIISVSRVRISPDFSVARCYLSIFPSEKSDDILHQLNQRIKELRYLLGNKIKKQVRQIPELVLFIDDSLDYIEKIESLLQPQK